MPNNRIEEFYNNTIKFSEHLKDNVEVNIKDEYGKVKAANFFTHREIAVSIWDMNMEEDLNVKGDTKPGFIDICFCLGAGVCWNHLNKGDFSLNKGELYIQKRNYDSRSMCYERGKNFIFFHLSIPEIYFVNLSKEYFDDKKCRQINKKLDLFTKSFINFKLEECINKLSLFNLNGELQGLYLESKTHEIISLCLNILLESENEYKNNLRRSDIDAINSAKKIIDNNFINLPTIEEISKKVYINPTKLSKGFKEIYKVPIHAYAIKKRLDYAHELLLKENYNVSEVAVLAGYSNFGHFSVAFKKNFGYLPSILKKQK